MNAQIHRDQEYLALVEEGASFFESKEYALALTHFWKAFRLRPSAPVVLFNLGRTLEELNDPRAEDFYAAAATQGDTDASYQLATLCLRNGRTDDAVLHIEAFLKLFKGNEDEYTAWARNTLQQLCPSPTLVWSKGKRLHEN